MPLSDPAFLAMTFVVIDFRGSDPGGPSGVVDAVRVSVTRKRATP